MENWLRNCIWLFVVWLGLGCNMTKTKHGTCENCAESERRIWVYVYESGAGLNSESCQLCRPLSEDGDCTGIYEWSYGDTGDRSEGPFECAERACAANASQIDITADYDPSGLFSQYDESAWITSCDN